MKKILPYNIVIVPPATIRQKAIKLSGRLPKPGKLFSLGQKAFVPHLTIYLFDLPAKNEKKVINALKELVPKLKPLRLTSSRYRIDEAAYVGMYYERTKSMLALQKKVIEAINPFREGVMRSKDKTRIAKLSAAKRKNVEHFGFTSVGSEYRPHLTLTRYEKEKILGLKGMEQQDFSFLASEIGFYHRGDHGTAQKLIAKFSLRRAH